VAFGVLGGVGVPGGEAVRVAAGTGPAAGLGVGIEVGESAEAAGVEVRPGLGAAVSSSPPPQLVATSPPTINIKSHNEPDRMC